MFIAIIDISNVLGFLKLYRVYLQIIKHRQVSFWLESVGVVFYKIYYFVQRLPDVMDLRAFILLPTNSKSFSLKSSITQQAANMKRTVMITIGM